MCLYPQILPNQKYVKNKKNGGNIPPFSDPRVLKIAAGCGQCIECRKQKARQWHIRLLEDIKSNTNGKFITLTFSNESIKQLSLKERTILNRKTKEQYTYPILWMEGYDRDNAIAITALRLFNERWRKKYKKAIRHWLVTEIGHKGTENIHLHGIIWTNEPLEEVEKIWQYGFIWKGQYKNGKIINYVNGRTVSYITKYVHKLDQKHKTFKSTVLCSPSIGHNYVQHQKYPYCEQYIHFNHKKRKWSLRVRIKYITYTINNGDWTKNKFKGPETNETYRTETGHKIALPKYYRNKIYTDEEREQLWVQLLNKNERWICGEKIDLNKTDVEEYYKLLEFHRKRNAELGYGTNQKNWKREYYEKQRRELLMKKRIE